MAAKKTAKAFNATSTQAFVQDLTDLFLKYNGVLWKVKDAGAIAAVAQMVAGTAQMLIALRK